MSSTIDVLTEYSTKPMRTVATPWGDKFPSLGLPNEQLGKISLWAGDPMNVDGVSVGVIWRYEQASGGFSVHMYSGKKRVDAEVSELFEAKALCVEFFERNKRTEP